MGVKSHKVVDVQFCKPVAGNHKTITHPPAPTQPSQWPAMRAMYDTCTVQHNTMRWNLVIHSSVNKSWAPDDMAHHMGPEKVSHRISSRTCPQIHLPEIHSSDDPQLGFPIFCSRTLSRTKQATVRVVRFLNPLAIGRKYRNIGSQLGNLTTVRVPRWRGYPMGYTWLTSSFKKWQKHSVKMLLGRLLATLLLLFTTIASRSKDDFVGEKSSSEIIGRFFPILPPYHGVDFGANFNRLKSHGDAAYFVVRDSIVVSWTMTIKTSLKWDAPIEPSGPDSHP